MATEPIAIVGIAHRLPGEQTGDLWESLLSGKDLVTEVGEDRWAKEQFLHPRKNEPGRAYTFASGSVGEIFGFDAGFFGISPREAEQMDPQQRMLLELGWMAFENAAIRPSSWRGSQCAVYVGISSTDYSFRMADDPASVDSTTATGNTASIAANRLSYFFDLRGPSLSVDTACSSSLIAMHHACTAIARGEADRAMVGGISLHMHPHGFINFSKTSMLSPRGRCAVFDKEGDGYARSEGGGVLLLMGMQAALESGANILAVIAGSGANCDGKTSSLTVPSAEAQAALLRQVYGSAGIQPKDLDYFEAHGTGTAVGDPIETYAIAEALSKKRPPSRPLPIGSIKSNIGHLEAASGIAGMVKALLILEHRRIPPTIHLKTPNSKIDFKEWRLRPVTSPLPLPATKTLTIGVNSFGFGGANAHIVLQSAPKTAKKGAGRTKKNESVTQSPVLLSAKSSPALEQTAANLATFLTKHPEYSVAEAASALWNYRDWMPLRLAVAAKTREETIRALEIFSQGREHPSAIPGERIADAAANPGAVFVFSGNGSQWPGMGRVLMEQEPLFASAVEELDPLFETLSDFRPSEFLRSENFSQNLERTELAQPALFAIQVGLVRVLEKWKLKPAAVLGHSVGEVAGAWASGALTLKQAVRVVHERSAHQGKTKGMGGMTAVAMGEEALGKLLESLPASRRPALAGINSDRGCTLAGAPKALEAAEAVFIDQGILFKRLDLDYAFHSEAMDSIESGIFKSLRKLQPKSGRIPFYSSVTGEQLDGCELQTAYWWRNVRDPVQFHPAMSGLLRDGFRIFIEIGPHPVLRAYVSDAFRELQLSGLHAATMTRTEFDFSQLQRAFFQAVLAGVDFPVDGFFPKPPPPKWNLPGYPWQKETFRIEQTPEGGNLVERRLTHPFLGYRLPDQGFTWECHQDANRLPWLADHAVGNSIVFPAAGFVEMALAAAKQFADSEPVEIEDFEIRSPLLLDDTRSKTVRLKLDPHSGDFVIQSKDRLSTDRWLPNAVGKILPASALRPQLPAPPPPKNLSRTISKEEHYRFAETLGLHYGPAFQTVESILCGENGMVANFQKDSEKSKRRTWILDPARFDGGLQSLLQLLTLQEGDAPPCAFLPIRFNRLRLCKSGIQPATAILQPRRFTRRSLLADLFFLDKTGDLIAMAEGARFRAANLSPKASDHAKTLLHEPIPKPRSPRSVFASVSTADFVKMCAASVKASEQCASSQKECNLHRFQSELEPLLETLCASFAAQTLASLVGKSDFSLEELLQKRTIAQDQSNFFLSLLRSLEQDSLIQTRKTETSRIFRLIAPPEIPADELWNALLMDYPGEAETIRAVGRIGLHLPELLQDSISLQELLPAEWIAHSDNIPLGIPGRKQQPLLALLDTLHSLATRSSNLRPRILLLQGPGAHRDLPFPNYLLSNACEILLALPSQQELKTLESQLRFFSCIDARILDFSSPESFSSDSLGGKFDAIIINDSSGKFLISHSVKDFSDILVNKGLLAMCESGPSRLLDFLFGSGPGWWLANTGGSGPGSRMRSGLAWEQFFAGLHFPEQASSPADPDFPLGIQFVAARPRFVSSPSSEEETCPQIWHLFHGDSSSREVADELQALLEVSGHRTESVDWRGSPAPKQLPAPSGVGGGLVFFAPLGRRESNPEEETELLAAALEFAGELMRQNQALASPLPLYLIASGAFPTISEGGHLDPVVAGLLGFARVAANEFYPIPVRMIDVRNFSPDSQVAGLLAAEILDPDSETEILLDGAHRWAFRLREVQPANTPTSDRTRTVLDFNIPGSFKNLVWKKMPLKELAEGEVEIEARAAGLNFRDVMYSMGLLPDEALEAGFAGQTLGMEVSGVIKASKSARFQLGQEVMAFASACFADKVVAKELSVIPKPGGWSHAAAATIPTAFFTVVYALQELARLQPGERLLVHGAAGAVGLAAIQYANHVGAEVYATAGSPEKRDFLRLLGVRNLFDSRSLSFAAEILEATNEEGIDVVLNSLAGEAINRNLRILRPFGKFLELGKRDFYENSKIGLRPFRNNIHYFGIDADQLMAERPAVAERVFREMLELFESGAFTPIPYRLFEAVESAEAFRFMQHSQQIGKVVLSIPEPPFFFAEKPRTQTNLKLRKKATYVITGGLSGFGLETAKLLANRGARDLVLLSRRGRCAATEAACVELEELGVRVTAPACDVADPIQLENALAEIRSTLPPIRGVFHAAMAIDDSLIRNLTGEKIRNVLHPKLRGALLLDQMTREDPLDYFVLFSSATTAFGNPGQAAYVAANLALEGLSAQRKSQGLPSCCISWGPLGDTGYLARNEQVRDALVSRMGGLALESSEALRFLENALMTSSADVAWLDLDWSALSRFLPDSNAPRFLEISRIADEDSDSAERGRDLRAELAALEPAELRDTLKEILKEQIGEILRIPAVKIDEARSLFEMGMDSLMGVELVGALENSLGVELPLMALSEGPTISKLTERIANLISPTGGESGEDVGTELTSQIRQVAAQHATGEASEKDIMELSESLSAENPSQ